MLFSQRIRKSIANGILVLFALMLLNGVVFRHAHKLSSGKIITHAHPYKPTNPNSPYQPNDHTSNELFLLDTVTNAVFVGLALTVALTSVKYVPFVLPTNFCFYYLLTAYRKPFFGDFSHRGPPAHQC